MILALPVQVQSQIRATVALWVRTWRGSRHVGAVAVSFSGVIAIAEVALAVFLATTWLWLLRQDMNRGWRRTASLAGLALSTMALVVDLMLNAVAHFHRIDTPDAAILPGARNGIVNQFWVRALLVAGILAYGGLVLSAFGEGVPRRVAVMWSSLILGIFVVNFLLAVSFFH